MRKFFYLLFVVCGVGLTAAFAQAGSDVKQALTEAAGFMRTGNFAEAEKVLQQARKAAPNNADVHNLLGIVYDQKGDFKEAETAYQTAIKLNPKAVSPLANFGVLLVKLKREKEAVEIFETALKIKPDHPQSIINLGFLYHSAGDFPRAAEFLKKANQLQPNSPDILFELAAALYQTKKFDEAGRIFGQLSPSAQTNYYLGLIAFAENNHEAARDYFEKSLALKPDLADANFMLGEILVKQRQYRMAKDYYEKAIASDDSKPVYHIRLGGTYIYQNEFYKAAEVFTFASQRFPKLAEIYYFLATAQKLTGLFDLALASLQKAISLKPDYADALILKGAILFDKNEFVEAEKHLRQAIVLSPDNFNANNDLGRLLVKQQKYAEALPFLQRASSLVPTIPDVHYQLYLAYSKLKRAVEAEKALELFKVYLAKEKQQ